MELLGDALTALHWMALRACRTTVHEVPTRCQRHDWRWQWRARRAGRLHSPRTIVETTAPRASRTAPATWRQLHTCSPGTVAPNAGDYMHIVPPPHTAQAKKRLQRERAVQRHRPPRRMRVRRAHRASRAACAAEKSEGGQSQGVGGCCGAYLPTPWAEPRSRLLLGESAYPLQQLLFDLVGDGPCVHGRRGRTRADTLVSRGGWPARHAKAPSSSEQTATDACGAV